jgi:ABC-type transport system substrate-binding protein
MLTAVLAGCGSKDAAPAGTDSAADTTDTATPADSGDSAAVPASAASGKILTFGCQMYSDGLINPASQTNCAWNCMRFGVGEALFKFNDSMEVEPWLAESDETADNINWTIKLKDGILFSNGDPMTATKVKESLDWVRNEGPNGSSNPQKYLPFEAEITADDAANTITIVLPTANMNQAEGRPLANDTLRQAILMAIDYKTICASNTIGNLYTPGFSVLPSTLAYGYDKLTNPWETNMDAAKKLLDDAGIVDTDGDGIRELDGQNINLTYVSYENRMLNDSPTPTPCT